MNQSDIVELTKAPDKVLREFCRKVSCPIQSKIDTFEHENPGVLASRERAWCVEKCFACHFNDYIGKANLTITKNPKRDRYN